MKDEFNYSLTELHTFTDLNVHISIVLIWSNKDGSRKVKCALFHFLIKNISSVTAGNTDFYRLLWKLKEERYGKQICQKYIVLYIHNV